MFDSDLQGMQKAESRFVGPQDHSKPTLFVSDKNLVIGEEQHGHKRKISERSQPSTPASGLLRLAGTRRAAARRMEGRTSLPRQCRYVLAQYATHA